MLALIFKRLICCAAIDGKRDARDGKMYINGSETAQIGSNTMR